MLQLVTEHHMHEGDHPSWDQTARKRQLKWSPVFTQDAGVIYIPHS